MRLLRGVNMCGVESYPYQVTSADQARDSTEPVDPPPNPGCTDQAITVNAKTSLVALARQYKTTTAAIQLDNGLDGTLPLENGQELLISCPSGTWSDVYGVWNGWNECEWQRQPHTATGVACRPRSTAAVWQVAMCSLPLHCRKR